MSHILVDANGAPVPLPFEVQAINGDSVTILGALSPDYDGHSGELQCRNNDRGMRCYRQSPCSFNLKFITEAEYMQRQEGETAVKRGARIHSYLLNKETSDD